MNQNDKTNNPELKIRKIEDQEWWQDYSAKVNAKMIQIDPSYPMYAVPNAGNDYTNYAGSGYCSSGAGMILSSGSGIPSFGFAWANMSSGGSGYLSSGSYYGSYAGSGSYYGSGSYASSGSYYGSGSYAGSAYSLSSGAYIGSGYPTSGLANCAASPAAPSVQPASKPECTFYRVLDPSNFEKFGSAYTRKESSSGTENGVLTYGLHLI